MDICPQCQINFDLIHQRCCSTNFVKYLQVKQNDLWQTIGSLNKSIDILKDRVDVLVRENDLLRNKKDGVVVDGVKNMNVQADGARMPALEALEYESLKQ